MDKSKRLGGEAYCKVADVSQLYNFFSVNENGEYFRLKQKWYKNQYGTIGDERAGEGAIAINENEPIGDIGCIPDSDQPLSHKDLQNTNIHSPYS